MRDKRILGVLVCGAMMTAGFASLVFAGDRVYDSTVVGGERPETESSGIEAASSDYRIIKDVLGYDRIEMLDGDYSVLESPGNPALPEKVLQINVPANVDWQSVSMGFTVSDSEVLPGFYNVPPVSPELKVTCAGGVQEDWGDGKVLSNGRNMEVYGRDADYPQQHVELLQYTERKEPSGQGFIDAAYVQIAYRPLLYNPVRGQLTFAGKVDIQLSYSMSPVPSTLTTYDYVIITTNDIVDNSEYLDNFIYLKELQGFSVKVVTEDDYGSLAGQAPNGVAEKVRQWLLNNYVSLGIDYVLLIGNPDPDDPLDADDSVGDLPMKMMYVEYQNWANRVSPTDYFYADLTGDWDKDDDQLFGENLPYDNPKSPDPSMGENTFSVEWRGKVKTDFAENYEFRTFSDDGVELFIDGTKVIDNWVEHAPTDDGSGALPMTVGKHDIKLRFRENTGDGIIRLRWKTTSSDHVEEAIIPDDHLYDMSDVVGGLDGTYYDNADFTGASLTRKDATVNFLWMTGDEGPLGMDTGAEVFVGRIPVYDDDYAQLDAILLKTIKYETEPGSIAWRESMLLPMKPLWPPSTPSYTLGEGIKNGIAVLAGFSYYRIYEEDFGVSPEKTPCEASFVKDEWEHGYGMTVWSTHGSSGGASHVFDNGMTVYLDDTKPALTFQGSCNNGYPEEKNNLGYALLKRGAVATVSASRVSWDYYGNWTFEADGAANHDLAYFYTKKVVTSGMTTGASLYLTKGNVDHPERNTMDYNLYGDPALYLLTVLPNSPPVADAGGPYTVDEGSTFTLDASGSYDPEGDALEYRWDLNDDGMWETDWSTSPTYTDVYGDDIVLQPRVEVRDYLALAGNDTALLTVENVDPTITDYEAYILVDFTLRVAGEKWHNVELYVYEDGTETGYIEVVRYPGSPDDQSVTITDVKCDVTESIDVKVLYTPEDDPVNGQPNGASPAWVNISFEDGGYVYLHHAFNVQHPETWEWDIGVSQFFVGHEITFEAEAGDPGSDDLTFTWSWDDGTPDDATTHYNDGVGPDPYPSIWGLYPFEAYDVAGHVFTSAGTYDVKLTVTDDDGGSAEIVMPVILA